VSSKACERERSQPWRWYGKYTIHDKRRNYETNM